MAKWFFNQVVESSTKYQMYYQLPWIKSGWISRNVQQYNQFIFSTHFIIVRLLIKKSTEGQNLTKMLKIEFSNQIVPY